MTTEMIETESTVTYSPLEEVDALHLHYPGQIYPQPCYVELDCEDGELYADSAGDSGVPFEVGNGLRLRWTIPLLTASAANALMQRIVPLCERIVAGFDTRWDGHNHVGELDADAEEAVGEVEALCDPSKFGNDDLLNVWDAGDIYSGLRDDDARREALGITAATTDEEIGVIAEAELDSARTNGIHAVHGLVDYLTTLRDRAPRAEVDESDDESDDEG